MSPPLRVLVAEGPVIADAVNGGNIFGRIVHFLHDLFGGPGDHRRPLDRP